MNKEDTFSQIYDQKDKPNWKILVYRALFVIPTSLFFLTVILMALGLWISTQNATVSPLASSIAGFIAVVLSMFLYPRYAYWITSDQTYIRRGQYRAIIKAEQDINNEWEFHNWLIVHVFNEKTLSWKLDEIIPLKNMNNQLGDERKKQICQRALEMLDDHAYSRAYMIKLLSGANSLFK